MELIIEVFKRLVCIKSRKIELDFNFVIKHLLMWLYYSLLYLTYSQ